MHISDDEKRSVLLKAGWSTWYNENYWANRKTVQNPAIQNHTDYGLSLDKAYEFETEKRKPFPSVAPFQRAISSLYQK